jgi:hypothetical protein
MIGAHRDNNKLWTHGSPYFGYSIYDSCYVAYVFIEPVF